MGQLQSLGQELPELSTKVADRHLADSIIDYCPTLTNFRPALVIRPVGCLCSKSHPVLPHDGDTMDQLPYPLAEPDFHRPIEKAAETGPRYEPGELPESWRLVPNGIRNVCLPAAGLGAMHDWQVHVSATPARARQVPGVTSAVCVGQGVPFIRLIRLIRLIRHANGGGAHVARAADGGREVFVKEARGHGGVHSDRTTTPDRVAHEYEMLRELDRELPGSAPRPIAYFRRREHAFLVTELIPGESPATRILRNLPGIRTAVDPQAQVDRHRRCAAILAEIALGEGFARYGADPAG
ncbi:hypothetical protein [Embleya sp. AB8]|uniref:class III lanthionine synthetase LanKC N-terminal domain-containing protein n=1 Tax=Embleya sp. AB8 TaxID=3156304 RepID=UPI003C73A109